MATQFLNGSCNCCGICCFAADGQSWCENLNIHGEPGQPDATSCSVWETLVPNRPIRMLRLDGSVAYESKCLNHWKDFIATGGEIKLPQECSYELIQINGV